METPSPTPTHQPLHLTRMVLAILAAAVLMETAALAFLIWSNKVNKQDRARKNAEIHALQELLDDAPPTTAPTEGAGAPLAYASLARTTITIPNDPEAGLPDLTPLQAVVNAKAVASACLQFHDLVGDGTRPRKNFFSWNDLDKADVRAKIVALIGDEARAEKIIESMKSWVKRLEYDPYGSLCKDNSVLYAFFALPGGTGIQPMRATADEFIPVNSTLKTMDLYYTFAPDAVDGRPIITTGYGDAGHWWWNYYLFDPATNGLDLVEACNANFAYGDQGFIETQVEYECARLYQMPK